MHPLKKIADIIDCPLSIANSVIEDRGGTEPKIPKMILRLTTLTVRRFALMALSDFDTYSILVYYEYVTKSVTYAWWA